MVLYFKGWRRTQIGGVKSGIITGSCFIFDWIKRFLQHCGCLCVYLLTEFVFGLCLLNNSLIFPVHEDLCEMSGGIGIFDMGGLYLG